MNILHITDLHLDDFKGQHEFLREGFFKEYIDRLHNSITLKNKDLVVDFLIVTGDFVNIGKIENYSGVEEIINYISLKFSINKCNICLSIGNHDYKWKELINIDNEKERLLKKPFKEFCNKFNSNYIVDCDNYFLAKLENNTIFLSLDSTWNSSNGAPGNISV